MAIVSDVMRIREQIELECVAAKRGIDGIAQVGGHDFVTAKYRQLDVLHNELKKLVPEDQATEMLASIHNTVMQDE